MYLEYFGLERPPFQLTPDSSFLFLSRPHARAIAYMKYAVLNHDGFTVISGEIGSGKTILVQKLISELDNRVLVARIHQTQLDEMQFLEEIAARFGLRAAGLGKVELLERLNQFLIEQSTAGRNVLLIVDEAQNLSPAVLEEIRLLADVEAFQKKVLSVILVGQPQLEEVLENPSLEQLDQRIRLRFQLRALTAEETDEYVRHRLEIAGWEGEGLFPAAAIDQIYRHTEGIPRRINVLCDTVLLAAYVDETRELTAELVDSAVEELNWKPPSARPRELGQLDGPSGEAAGPHGGEAAAPSSRLAISLGGKVLSQHPLDAPYVTVGRTTDNHVQLPHPSVSRHHAALLRAGGQYLVVDLGSTNGTKINGRPVIRQYLRHGDILGVGQYQLRFSDRRTASVPHSFALRDVLDDTLTRFSDGPAESGQRQSGTGEG